jgi:short subunit dehydrogenase-like uncharacterized protein
LRSIIGAPKPDDVVEAGNGSSRPYDVVLMGVTGYTGRLVAECLLRRAPGGLSLGVAGRSRDKLDAALEELARAHPNAKELGVLVADSHDRAQLDALAKSTKVVCTTVGPYARHGAELVAACARHGTSYCDLTGEPHFIRHMIDAHHAQAEKTGARIVHASGFDSIPSDLGTWLLQRAATERFGRPAGRVRLVVERSKGGLSGGTLASMSNLIQEARSDRAVRKILTDPYSLTGGWRGPDGPDAQGVKFDSVLDGWTAPFIMASINTRVVRRTHALLGLPWGDDFSYSEVMRFPKGRKGALLATAVATGTAALALGFALPTRKLLERVLPQPGQGPSESSRQAGYFRIRLWGEGKDASGKPFRMSVRVADDRDPGYASTAEMLSQAALCLAEDELDSPGGVLTPASAMGDALLKRLRAVGLTFEVE